MMLYQDNTVQEKTRLADLLDVHHDTPKMQDSLDERVTPYSVWAVPPEYTQDKRYSERKKEDYASESGFHSHAPEVWVRPMQRVVQLPPEWVGKGVRGYCIPTMNTEISWIRNNDPDPWRVNTHEYFHFNYLGGGDGSEGFVHMLEHWRLGEEPYKN